MKQTCVAMILVASCSVGVAQAAARKPVKPLTAGAAKARVATIMRAERADEFGARERIGGDFTVTMKYCQLKYESPRPWKASCAYWIVAIQQTSSAPDGSPVHRRCVVNVEVRKSSRTGRVTHTRKASPCYEPQPPVTGPPVGSG